MKGKGMNIFMYTHIHDVCVCVCVCDTTHYVRMLVYMFVYKCLHL